MSRFEVTFSIDPGESSQTFQPLTPQQSARRLMQTTLKLHKTVGLKRVPPALRERTSFSEIIRKQEKALAKLKKQIERKGSMRIRGIELAKKLKSPRRSSSDTQGTSSPSKETDFGEVMEHQERELTRFRGAVKDVIRKLRQKKQKALAEELAKAFSKQETEKQRKEREERETKLELQKEKDVVDLWNILLTHMRDRDPTLIDKIKFPDDVASKLTGNIRKTYKYFKDGKKTLETEDFNYYEKFHPEKQRTFTERRVTYIDKDLPPLVDPEPDVDFYLEFDKANVDKIKSMCLRLRNLKGTESPLHYYWLYIEATPITADGKKAGPTKYESFYTFGAKLELFERILESREKRNEVLLSQSQSQSQSESQTQVKSQARTSGRKKKKTRGKEKRNGNGRGSRKSKQRKRR